MGPHFVAIASFAGEPDMKAAFRSERYAAERERAWHLSAWLSPEVSAWCVQDVRDGSCVALQADKGGTLPAQDLLPARPGSVSFTVLPEISALVPESALTPGSEMRHLQLVHGRLPAGVLRDEPIAPLGARCVYLHDEQAEHALLTRHPNARPVPMQSILVQAAMGRSAKGAVVWVERSHKRVDLAIARRQQLLLSNSFHAANAEDVLYYTLFALEQCKVRPAEVHALLSGLHLSAEDEQLLARYLPDTAPGIAPTDLRAPRQLVAPHRFAALIEQFACAS